MKSPILYAAIALVLIAQSAPAASSTWINAKISPWSDSTAWSGGVAPTSNQDNVINFTSITQNSTGTLTTSDFKLNQLNTSGTNSSKTLAISNSGGGFLEFVTSSLGALPQLNLNRTNSGGGATNISVPFTVTNTLTINSTGNTTTISGAVTNNGGIVLTGTSAFTWSSVISGAGTLQMNMTNVNETLSGSNSTYTGATIISSGTLTVAKLVNGGSNSSIGASSNVASNLVLDGGALQYTGTATVNTDRLFTVTQNGGTITASSSANSPVNFTNTGAVGFSGSGARTLTITGTSTGANSLAASIGDGSGGATSLTKSGTGQWTLTGSNSYSGGTAVNAGTLLLSNSTGSASGTGSLTVGAGATLGGTGTSNGAGFSLSGTGTATGSRANVLAGLNSASDTSVTTSLALSGTGASTIQNANLTFNLDVPTNGQSSQLNVGSTAITFGSGSQSVTFTLNLQGAGTIGYNNAYVLVAGNTTGGTDQYSGLTLGTSTGTLATGLITPILDSGIGGAGNLSIVSPGLASAFYGAGSNLFLYQNSTTGADDIEVQVVPEPGTWAMMLGGLTLLVFIQRRRRA